MNSPTFKDLPKVTEFEIPFNLKEDLLLEWLLELSKKNSQEACKLLLQFLQRLNNTKLAAKTRVVFLKNSQEYFKQYVSRLEGSCWDASLPLSATEQAYVETVVWNYLALAEGFLLPPKN